MQHGKDLLGRIGLFVATLSTLAACNAHPLKEVRLSGEQEKSGNVAVSINRDVDILFVIDNSRSMAEEQATLARNFGPLLERLEQGDVRANYRIAITTTDNGHSRCTGRDGGNFKLDSCLGRRDDFQAKIDGVDQDFFDEACAEICAHDDIEILPTATFQDPTPRARPWIENIEGVTNLADGITPVEAFKCFAPQGLTGCGFESPLESMRLGLLQADDDRSEELGFLRPGAILAVVFVTDEADCSARWAEVPDPWDIDNGSRALWSPENAESGQLTSEVCWFGGVECEDSPDGTKECWAVNKAADGSVTDDLSKAVLHPVDRYVDMLAEIEAKKQEIDPDQQVLVAVLTGVPTDYDGGRIYYSDGNDPKYLSETGIGAGCESANGKAAPPVRLAEVADAFRTSDDDVNLYSVCKEDYSDAMSSIADAIGKQVRPPCVETCVADADPTREGLQHECQVQEEHVTLEGERIVGSIPRCEATDEGFRIPDQADACYRSLTDADGATATADDDMSGACVDEGWNLELAIERRDGAVAPSGAIVRARCSVSQLRVVDCPGLDG